MWNNHLAVLVLQNKDGKIHPSPSPNITSELWGHAENRGFLASNASNCFPYNVDFLLHAAPQVPHQSMMLELQKMHTSLDSTFLTLACMISITGFTTNYFQSTNIRFKLIAPFFKKIASSSRCFFLWFFSQVVWFIFVWLLHMYLFKHEDTISRCITSIWNRSLLDQRQRWLNEYTTYTFFSTDTTVDASEIMPVTIFQKGT